MKDLLDIIIDKREGRELGADQIQGFVRSICSRTPPPDYQVASLLSFIFCRGLSFNECLVLTRAMRDSGKKLAYKGYPQGALFCDKHSTGGVGDKITLPLLALVASGSERVYLPTIAGRGLGHSGGTVDKLEGIPGMNVAPSSALFHRVLKKHRMCFGSQTKEIAPADRVLYALRDVTGTVPSIPLITASILSKKLAESLDYLLLDVKFGSGAFMRCFEDAEKLAESLIAVCRLEGVRATACLTDMDSPLGEFSGNRLEVWESLQILKGEGPETSTELSLSFAEKILEQAGEGNTRQKLKEAVESGRAFDKFKDVVEAQGGSLARFERVFSPKKLKRKKILARQSGLLAWDVYELGMSLVELGAGRRKKTDRLDFDVGIRHLRRTGQRVEKGELLLEIFYKDSLRLRRAQERIERAIQISPEESAATDFANGSLIRKFISTMSSRT